MNQTDSRVISHQAGPHRGNDAARNCPPSQGLLPRGSAQQATLHALAEAGRLAHMNPLAEDQVRPEWPGDVIGDATGLGVNPGLRHEWAQRADSRERQVSPFAHEPASPDPGHGGDDPGVPARERPTSVSPSGIDSPGAVQVPRFRAGGARIYGRGWSKPPLAAAGSAVGVADRPVWPANGRSNRARTAHRSGRRQPSHVHAGINSMPGVLPCRVSVPTALAVLPTNRLRAGSKADRPFQARQRGVDTGFWT